MKVVQLLRVVLVITIATSRTKRIGASDHSGSIACRLDAARKFVEHGSSTNSTFVFKTFYQQQADPDPFDTFYLMQRVKVKKLSNKRRKKRLDGVLSSSNRQLNNKNQPLLATVTLESSTTKNMHDSTTEKRTATNNTSQKSLLSDWCGTFTPIAAAEHPDRYSSSTAAVVLITGIFSHPLGVHLAKLLQNECPFVSTIIGMDPILPNNKSSQRHIIRVVEERMKLMYASDSDSSSTKTHFRLVPTPFYGLEPRQKHANNDGDDWDIVNLYQPTHIVHLLSYKEDQILKQREELPYFQIRQSRTSMEQILTSIYKATHVTSTATTIVPHLVYASSSIDDILVKSYATLFNLTSPMIGLRFSSIYGPTSTIGSDVHDMATNAALGPDVPIIMPPNSYIVSDYKGRPSIDSSSRSNSMKKWWQTMYTNESYMADFIHVEDATQAVITAMQYYPSNTATTVFHVASGNITSLLSIALLMEQELPRRSKYSLRHFIHDKMENITNNNDNTDIIIIDQLVQPIDDLQYTKNHLSWQPRISIQDGISQTLNWFFLRQYKHGPTMQKASQYARGDHASSILKYWIPPTTSTLPCTSECASSNLCITNEHTIWNDELLKLVRKITNGFEIVLYTVMLNAIEVIDIMGDSHASHHEQDEEYVIKIAFVQKESDLVKKFLRKNKKITSTDDDLFGTFQYGEFQIIYMSPPSGSSTTVTEADLYYAKMAPGSLFGESVLYALFVDFYSRSYPSTNEIMYMIEWMKSSETSRRTKHIGSIPNRKEFTMPARPARSAVMLFQTAVVHEEKGNKVDLVMIKKFLNHAMLGLDVTQDTPQRQAQMKFYDSVHQLFTMDEFRDFSSQMDDEPPPIFTGLVIHDLSREEGRQLRCDWYKEHLFWNGSELEDRSLSYVLSQRAWAERHGHVSLRDENLPGYLSDDGWIAILRPLANLTQTQYHYPYAIPTHSITGIRMYSNQMTNSHGDILCVKLTRQDISESLIKELYEGVAALSKQNKLEASVAHNAATRLNDDQSSSNISAPNIVETDEEEDAEDNKHELDTSTVHKTVVMHRDDQSFSDESTKSTGESNQKEDDEDDSSIPETGFALNKEQDSGVHNIDATEFRDQ